MEGLIRILSVLLAFMVAVTLVPLFAFGYMLVCLVLIMQFGFSMLKDSLTRP